MHDESGAPWPYEPVELEEDEPDQPRWKCPEDICQCHAPEGNEAARRPHKIFFHDEMARKLQGARCRVFENGKLINVEAPWADGGAAVEVKILPTTRSLRIEWAPAEMPMEPQYPFRKIYHLDLGEEQDEGVRRRLHNLGFTSAGTLFEKVCDFQRAYHQTVTGRCADVEHMLLAYHDDGALPPLTPSPNQGVVAAPPPAPPPAGGGPQPAAAPGVQQQGSVAPIELLDITVRVATRFLLTRDNFPTTGADWSTGSESPALAEALRYDLHRIVEELGGTSDAQMNPPPPTKPMAWRWTNRSNRPIDGAKVTLTISKDPALGTTEQRTEITQGGQVVFKLVPMNFRSFTQGKAANATLRIEPPTNQLSTGPAGPDLPTKGLREDFLFRPFTVELHFDKKGVLVADSVAVVDAGKPAFAAVFSEVPIQATRNRFVIELDWKPDWMRGHSNPRASRTRFTDPSATPGTPGAIEPVLGLHITANQNVDTGTLAGFFHRSANKVSAHYVVDLDGHAVKMVDESEVSWHINPSVWQSRNAVNEFSVGMEIVHTNLSLGPSGKATANGGEDNSRRMRRFPEEQYKAIKRICDALIAKYQIAPSRVVGHSDVNFHGSAIEGRQDPSEIFDWEGLGIGLSPSPYTGSDATILALRNATATIERAPRPAPTGAAKTAREDAIRKVKELLFEIGYAVTQASPVAGSRGLTVPLAKPTFTGDFDAAFVQAIKAFQIRYFSGKKRRYKFGGPPPEPDGNKKPGPDGGTLDPPTLKAIVDVWNDRQTRG